MAKENPMADFIELSNALEKICASYNKAGKIAVEMAKLGSKLGADFTNLYKQHNALLKMIGEHWDKHHNEEEVKKWQ